jgi:hypothetical protein
MGTLITYRYFFLVEPKKLTEGNLGTEIFCERKVVTLRNVLSEFNASL